jgi:hypothetical protein
MQVNEDKHVEHVEHVASSQKLPIGEKCMARRRTARGIRLDENCLRPLSGEFSGRVMMIRACPSLTIATVMKDLISTRGFSGHAV